MQEVVVKGDLSLLGSINKSVPTTAFQIVLYTDRVVNIENDVLSELHEEVLG